MSDERVAGIAGPLVNRHRAWCPAAPTARLGPERAALGKGTAGSLSTLPAMQTAMTSTESLTQPVEVLRAPVARSWSPAQLIAFAIGFMFMVWGLVNIGHSGFHPERVFQPHDALAGTHYTPFLAALEVGSAWRCSSGAPCSGRRGHGSGPERSSRGARDGDRHGGRRGRAWSRNRDPHRRVARAAAPLAQCRPPTCGAVSRRGRDRSLRGDRLATRRRTGTAAKPSPTGAGGATRAGADSGLRFATPEARLGPRPRRELSASGTTPRDRADLTGPVPGAGRGARRSSSAVDRTAHTVWRGGSRREQPRATVRRDPPSVARRGG